MNQELESTLSKIVSSQEHMVALSKCTSPQEAYDFALTHGGGFTLEEFVSASTELNKFILRQVAKDGKLEEVKSAVEASTNPYAKQEVQAVLDTLDAEGFGELTDDDLLMVAGGLSDAAQFGILASSYLATAVGLTTLLFFW